MKRKFLFFANVILLLWAQTISAQWQITNGPYGKAQAILADSGTIFVGTQGSIFTSVDNGATWNENNLYIQPPLVYSIIKAGENYFASTSRGIYKLNNQQWEIINSNIIARKLFYDGSKIWAASESGVYYSSDEGTTWTNSLSFQNFDIALTVFKHEGVLLVGTQSTGIFRSTDDGVTWSKADGGIDSTATVYDFAYLGGWIYASVNGWAYRSDDNGDIWSSSGYGLRDGSITDFYVPTNGYNIYAATDDGVYWNTQPSQEWQKVGDRDFVYNRINSISSENGTLYFAGEAGVFSMTNAPFGYWEGKGMPNTSVERLCKKGDKLFAVTQLSSLQYTIDNGNSWTTGADRIFESLPNSLLNDIVSTDTSIFVASASGLLRLNQSDNHWMTYLYGTNVLSVAISGNTVYAGTQDDGVLVSHNGFQSNAPLNNGLPTGTVNRIFVLNNYLYASIINIGLYRLGINDTTWNASNSGMGNLTVTDLYEKDGTIFASTLSGLFKSNDNGDSWTETDNGIYDKNIFSVYGIDSTLFVGTMYGGVYISTDFGESWESFNDNFANNKALTLFSDSLYLYAGTDGHGVWRRPLSDIVVGIEDESPLPVKFTLAQNYPNPFSKSSGEAPTTTIKYSIPAQYARDFGSQQNVRLDVYDILGRRVATLVNQNQPAGTYTVKFNASNLNTGVYFYTLKVGNSEITKKMILMK